MNVRTGEPVDCEDLGAVSPEVYNDHLPEGEEPVSEGGSISSSTLIAIAVSAGAVVLVGGALFLMRRRRSRRTDQWIEDAAVSSRAQADEEAVEDPTSPSDRSAGWHPDPREEGGVRYWDGSSWTDRTQGAAEPSLGVPEPSAGPTAPAPLATPAGWYPDPNMVDTQRYWDGNGWTDQYAPMPAKASRSSEGITFWAILAFTGAAAAVIGTFLPYVENESIFPVRENSLIQSGAGWVVILLAIGALTSEWKQRNSAKRNWVAIVLGALIVALAFYSGTDEQLKLINGAGETSTGSPGIGLYVIGLGGSALVAAGLRE